MPALDFPRRADAQSRQKNIGGESARGMRKPRTPAGNEASTSVELRTPSCWGSIMHFSLGEYMSHAAVGVRLQLYYKLLTLNRLRATRAHLPLVSREWKNGSNGTYNSSHSSIPY